MARLPHNRQRLDQLIDQLYPQLRSILVDIASRTAFHFLTEEERARLALCINNPDNETQVVDLRLNQTLDDITRQAAEAATLSVLTIGLGAKLDP